MTIQIELNTQAEAKLIVDVSAHGLAPETYAGRILQEPLATSVESPEKFTVEQFHAMLDALGNGSESLPSLPTESFSRESFTQIGHS